MPANRNQIRLSLVEQVFNQYLQITRAFWKEAEKRATKTIPGWRAALGDGFARQLILIDSQALRFGHLLTTDEFTNPQLSLNDITERLDKHWSDADEKSLIAANPVYREIVEQQKTISSRWKPDAASRSLLKALQLDPKYVKAREAVGDRVRELSDRLRNSDQ
jgi:hypothetical protein